MSANAWLNIGLMAIFSFYLALYLFPIWQGSLLTGLGADYPAFWAAGYIANHWGYAEMYSFEQLTSVQQQIVSGTDKPFAPIPAPYPPLLFVPFQLMAIIPINTSFWIWQILNFISIIGYLAIYIKRLGVKKINSRPILMALLFMPVFHNFSLGQPGIWFMICVGEFLIWSHKGRPFLAGLWLSGVLLKPQLLILFVPALLLQRYWKMLAGFTFSSSLIVILSLWMLGHNGLVNLSKMFILLGTTNAVQAINPHIMINWRMFGLHFAAFLPDWVAWSIVGLGTITSIVLSLSMWRKSLEPDDVRFDLSVFGLISATCIATWHSHQHGLMLLVPVFLALSMKNVIPLWLQYLWLFFIPVATLLAYIIPGIMVYSGVPINIPVGALITGMAGLILGIVFLLWSLKKIQELDS